MKAAPQITDTTPAKSNADIQQSYYASTATLYDRMHIANNDEHSLALAHLDGLLDYFKISSVLDVGSGTGRALRTLLAKRPNLHALGIEPVRELREVGYSSGLTKDQLIDGDANKLPFEDKSFDLVCAFGMLHHVATPDMVISEMLRVARLAIFISDCNNFGQGTQSQRLTKRAIKSLGLWGVFNYLKTKGKGYSYSEGDGLYYSYSVFTNYSQIKSRCKDVFIMNTKGSGKSAEHDASHIALFGVKAD